MAARSARCWRCIARSSRTCEPLPLEGFRYFKPGTRTVDDAGLVQVEGSYYAALPAPLHSEVQVRIYAREIEILDAPGSVLRRHAKATRKGQFVLEREAIASSIPRARPARLLAKAGTIGPKTRAAGAESSSPASAAPARERSTG